MTKTLAVEWASSGIRVNSVAPGIIFSSSAAANYGDSGLLVSTAPRIPAKRLGTPEEIAAAVLFLLSPASSYITGETLKVDGGSSIFTVNWEVSDHENMPAFAGDSGPKFEGGLSDSPFHKLAKVSESYNNPSRNSKL